MQQFPQSNILSPRSGVLIAMIALAVGMRLFIHFVPGALPYNFTPVEAIALFGFVLRFSGFSFSQIAAFYLAGFVMILFFSPKIASAGAA